MDAGEFVQAINDLTPNGGGDCPEYAFTGMLEALYQEPQWGSPMYVFTDAGPKDASDEFIEEVKYLASAEEYGVTINFFTTGKKCNNRFVSKIVHKIIIAFSGTKKANVLCYARR